MYSFLVYSRFGLDMFLIYSRFGLDRLLVYSRFELNRFHCKWRLIVVFIQNILPTYWLFWGRHCRGRMVVGFTTTYAISAYHHWSCEFESRSGRGVQYFVIKFISDLRQIGGFLRVLRFPPSIKLTATI